MRIVRGSALAGALLLQALHGNIAAGEREQARLEAEIVLTDSPFCTFFVTLSRRGYSVLSWQGGYEIFSEGDRIVGDLESPGLKEVELVLPPALLAAIGPLHSTVLLEEVDVPRATARRLYARRCNQDRTGGSAGH
jgi:hypothetical protein